MLSGAAEAVSVINILEGIPATRNGLRSLLGRYNTTDIFFTSAELLALTLSSNLLGLALTGAGALRLFTEVRARRAAFCRYEERLTGVASAQPGAVIRLGSGQRTPLNAEVIEGTGTAVGEDGLPVPIAPGRTVGAGARLYGGPFVLELKVGRSFTPELRPAPVLESLYDRYAQAVGRLSLGYAALTALLTGSLSRSFTALLLVSPRTALIGKQAADASASARVLCSGVTVVGTRLDRVVQLPSALLIDGPRVLSDGLEVSSTLPLGEGHNVSEILDHAAAVATAAGSPWGSAFLPNDCLEATEGDFDGDAATACIEGTRYSLHPVDEWESLPAEMRIRNQGRYPLLLTSEREKHSLGVLVLQPKLAPGVADVLRVCRRRGVKVDSIPAGDPTAAQAGLRGRPDVEQASYAIYIAALSALAIGWVRLRGRGFDGSTQPALQ